MVEYLNLNHNSNVEAYQILPMSIIVKFRGTNKPYVYSYYRAGLKHVENMKILAIRGFGLNSYIMRNCRKLYD